MGLFSDESSNFKAKARDVFKVRLTNITFKSFFNLIHSPIYPKDMNFFKWLYDDLSWSIFRLNIDDFINEYKDKEISPISTEEFVSDMILPSLQRYILYVNNLCRKPFYHGVSVVKENQDEKSALYSVWFEHGRKHKKTQEFNILVSF